MGPESLRLVFSRTSQEKASEPPQCVREMEELRVKDEENKDEITLFVFWYSGGRRGRRLASKASGEGSARYFTKENFSQDQLKPASQSDGISKSLCQGRNLFSCSPSLAKRLGCRSACGDLRQSRLFCRSLLPSAPPSRLQGGNKSVLRRAPTSARIKVTQRLLESGTVRLQRHPSCPQAAGVAERASDRRK